MSATMYFANLGSTPNGKSVLAAGNLYVLILTENLPGLGSSEGSLQVLSTAFLFDLRRPIRCVKCDKKKSARVNRNDPPVPSVPEFNLGTDDDRGDLPEIFRSVNQVYLIDLAGFNSEGIGKVELQALFSNAVGIAFVSHGDSDWHPCSAILNRGGVLETINAVEETYSTEIAEKLPIDPFDVFVFSSIAKDRSASVLVSGEISGRLFSFFFGSPIFKTVLGDNRVRDRKDQPLAPHFLSVGKWRAFYSFEESKLPPVREPIRQT